MAIRAGTLRPVGAVIVHHESPDDLARCLASLTGDPCRPDEVVVVDNSEGEADRAAAASLTASAGARLVDGGGNLGFAAGCNLGASTLRGCGSVLFINQDAELGPGGLAPLLDGLADHPRLAAVNPLITTPEGRVWFAGGRLDPWMARLRFPSFGRPSSCISRKRPLDTGWLNGCALLVRSAAWDEVGGFDERFFLYWEDVEWSQRAREAGWELEVNPAAEVIHHRDIGGDGLRTLTPVAIEHAIASRLLFVRHHLERRHRPTGGLYTAVNAVRLVGLGWRHGDHSIAVTLRAAATGVRRGLTG